MKEPIRRSTAARMRTLLDEGAAGPLADGELLERFASREGDPAEAAFAALVERHGPMVLRACRSILRDPHRAEDAFQVTFQLLARRAGSLWVRDTIGPWLHSVACRVASGTRAAEIRQARLLRRAAVARAPSLAIGGPGRDDLGSALHEAIERLPDRLRAPLVLCHLEGLTHDQAAEHLRCPVGTVRSRLARGRDRLRRDLARRGFTPPAESAHPGPIMLPTAAASLAIQAARLTSGRAAAGPLIRWSLTSLEGAFRAMTIHPLKATAAILLASGVLAAGLGATPGQDSKEKVESSAARRNPEPVEPRPRFDKPLVEKINEARIDALVEARVDALSAESRSLRLRVEDLERRLEAFEPGGKLAAPAKPDPRSLRKIRPRFDDALVETIHVQVGRLVKAGDPLLVIRSTRLAQARNDCRSSFVQWDHDRKYLIAREPLAKDGRITSIVWIDTVNSEKKSRLEYLIARERLIMFGMTGEAIDKLLEDVGDGRDRAPAIEDNTRITLTSPLDGSVVTVDAEPDGFYGQKDVLLVIAPLRP